MAQRSISVIIPAFRAAKFIGRAVESVLKQTYPAHEILVIDDGSPDDLASALRPCGDKITLIRKENGGAASARNLGIDRATGDLIAFLDADDYWQPQKLVRHVELYERHPELGLTCSRYFNQEADGERVPSTWDKYIPYDRVATCSGKAAFELATRIWTATVVVPRQILGEDRFPLGFSTAEDRHLWVRLAQAAPVYFLSEPLATAVLEKGSLSRSNADRDFMNMLRLVESYRDLLGWTGTCKWKSHTYFRWAAVDPSPTSALARLSRSIVLWPLPYAGNDVTIRCARLKVFVVTVMRMVGLKPPLRAAGQSS